MRFAEGRARPRGRELCLVAAALLVTWWATSPADAARALRAAPFAATKGAPVPARPDARADELLVRFKPGRAAATMEAVEAAKGIRVRASRRLQGTGWHCVRVAPGRSVRELVEAYRQAPDVLYAEPNYRVHAFQDRRLPDDPDFSELWGLDNTGQSGGTADADIDAPEAWHRITAATVLVAVIDSGIDYTHPDLAANTWTNPGEIADNGIDDDGNGYTDDVRGWDFANDDNDPMDDDGHGTHCAGTLGAVGNNATGVAGVCWSVKILPVKFINETGTGTTADAVEAIAYATALGAKVMSNSWGSEDYS
ncbi:MAG: S8 family serine peptidase, partial [Planctomycetota bacterium]